MKFCAQISMTKLQWPNNHSTHHLAPLKTRLGSFTHSAPCYTCELRKMKTAGRATQRHLRSSDVICWLTETIKKHMLNPSHHTNNQPFITVWPDPILTSKHHHQTPSEAGQP
ncbi:hypothetical protein CHARACLAT_019002 [Characodon lateralis]|uniref:Uncharacterized protein n=1 Tax=Characodon lateralis TaxID=208331 RepID=A0ABU7CPD0_9TELE|nr:hypothetical protein [Characodon lateralis]